MPFFHVKHDDLIPSDEAIFDIARDYPELPSHFYSKLLGRDHSNTVNRLAQLAHLGHLNVLKPFINPREKVSKHDSFSFKAYGYRDRQGREHRVGESIVKASTHIGANAHADFEYITFRQIKLLPSFPRETLRIIDNGGDPNNIPLSDGHVHPDGNPGRLYHQPSDKHQNIIDEFDNDTEGLTSKKDRRNILEKYEKYELFYKEEAYKERYGFRSCLLRWVTISEGRMYAIMRLYEDHFGRCSRNLYAHFKGNPFTGRSYPAADGHFFNVGYKRIGYPDYYLNTFYEPS